ncbi:MAG: type II toxin-antitoxin system RelE/ParE family toxin [Nitrospirae bacterium]|nr:type II toxin-antitoxin system RelE/ParE family toxin [Nitrospirota bacterium]
MIESFAHKGLEVFFHGGSKKGIQPQHGQKLADILDRLDAAKVVKDMNFPGSDLHRLKGKMKELWSVKVSGNWRVVFSFKEGNAINVDYMDYH